MRSSYYTTQSSASFLRKDGVLRTMTKSTSGKNTSDIPLQLNNKTNCVDWTTLETNYGLHTAVLGLPNIRPLRKPLHLEPART